MGSEESLYVECFALVPSGYPAPFPLTFWLLGVYTARLTKTRNGATRSTDDCMHAGCSASVRGGKPFSPSERELGA